MTDDPIHTLERELVAAAHRAAAPAPAARGPRPADSAAAAPGPAISCGARTGAPGAGGGAGRALGLGGSHIPGGRSPVGATPRTVLGVLRRSGAIPNGQALSTIERVTRMVRDPTVTLQRSSLRQPAVTVASGVTVPLGPGGRAGRRRATAHRSHGPSALGLGPRHSEMMYLYADRTDQAYSSVAQLRTNGVETWLGPDRDGTEDYAVLVPDGVTRVRLDAPGHPVATVRDNVAGFRLSDVGATSFSKQLGMTWLGAADRVVHRVVGAHPSSPPSCTRESSQRSAAFVRTWRCSAAARPQPTARRR